MMHKPRFELIIKYEYNVNDIPNANKCAHIKFKNAIISLLSLYSETYMLHVK